jgi:DNA repair exonuclease SbcCD ATPase subunit
MRLLSLNVRNYRIHRDITVDFDPSRNLIGGTNETGKSTLAEAIHRALFMRHRAGGEAQRLMKSDVHNGHPEVRLIFEAGGQTWTLDKRFSGTNGTARLSSSDGTTLQGDAVEDRLALIVGNPEGAASTPKQLSSQWSHLWVWQGTAGDDASAHTAGRRDELVQRLQQQGLAAVMQSATDERARQKVRLAHDEIFIRNGGVKTNSRLDLANKALADANSALTRAIERKQQLESAIIEQESAAKALSDSINALPAKREELTAVNESLAKARELHSRCEREDILFQNATTARSQLASADQQIRDLLCNAASVREALIPAEAKLSILADQEKAAQGAASAAEFAHRAISETVRLARQYHDLANACVSRFEKSAAHEVLKAKARDIAVIEESFAADREALSKLPIITAAHLESLRKIESQIAQADSALNAIAAGIELISSDQAVLLDGQPLESGKPRVITEMSELSLGSGTLLRIQPGGGTSLAESRRKFDDVRKKLTTALDQLAIQTSSEAAEIVTKRQLIEQRISNTEARLQDLGSRELPETLAAAAAAFAAAAAEVDHRRAALPPNQTLTLPDTLEAALTWQSETREALKNAESQERSLLAVADAQRKAHQEKLQSHQAHRESLESERRNLADLDNSARTLEQIHGDATSRATTLAKAIDTEATAKAALDATAAALTELNPELLQQQVTRLTRVISLEEEKQRDAETRIAVARNTLALDGSSDPEAEFLQAKARHAAVAEEQAREQRHADSIHLLHQLFSESQSAITESVTQPIADRVAGYLACIFGHGVRVAVDLASPTESSIKLTRLGTPSFSFDSLSGGAKEQVAAALRLATAEILSANHDGCLPILFDDAFAYADDDRIQSLQTMLDLAATRGLQVLVLTCTPAAYIGLGARETRLTPHLWSSTPASSNLPAPVSPIDAAESNYVTTSTPPSGDTETAFLDTLRAQGGSAGNLTLRTALGWDESTYELVKNSLIGRRIIIAGQGRGGSVKIPLNS